LQEFGEKLASKVHHTAAAVNLSTAGTRPTAQNDTYDLTNYRGELTIDAEHGVLANDGAAAGSKVLLVRPAEHGTVTLNADGSLRYTYDFERMQNISDTFAYVVVNADGTSEFAEVDIRADKVPPLAEARLRAVNANGIPLDHVEAGQPFFLQAVVTDLRLDGVGSLPNARGANDVRIDLSFDNDAIQVVGEVSIDSEFDGSTKTHTKVWAKVGPGDIRVRGVSDTGPRTGELEIFRVPMVALAAGTAEVSFDEARIELRPNLINIPERLVRIQGLSLEVRENSRPWANRVNPNDVTGDGAVAPADALEIVNYLNARGSGPVPAVSTLTAATSVRRVYLDTDADNVISPADALRVINHLNGLRGGGEGESASPPTAPNTEPSGVTEADLLTLLATDLATESRRRR
jgi:hypothetical protein